MAKGDRAYCRNMGKAARLEAERWGWEAATSDLRNIQYERALVNFHSRAFGGFGRPRTTGMWRLLGWRISRIMKKVGVKLRTRNVFSSVWKRFFQNKGNFLSDLFGRGRGVFQW